MSYPMDDEANFETRLTQTLQRVDAPEGFAARIMDRVAEPAEAKAATAKVIAFHPRMQRYVGLGLAAMLTLGVFGMEEIHQRHERAMATQQFETATRITDQTLEHTRQQLERVGVPLD